MTSAKTTLDKAAAASSIIGTGLIGVGGLLASVMLIASGVAAVFMGIFLYFAGADWT
jgi:hypothetical protein